MRTLDRYVLSQMLTLFGFFALVLAGIYWINRAVDLFETLISDGQSALVFVEFSLLTLPTVIRLVIPVAAFAAAIYVTNRMRGESEIAVLQAAGLSPLRGLRPVLVFGLCAGALCFALAHVLGPLAKERLAARSDQLAGDVTASLLAEGRFLHPTDGVTLFIGEIGSDGELGGIFLSDRRAEDGSTTYAARTATLVPGPQGPQMVMYDGIAQTLDSAGRLGTTRFEDFSFGISSLERGGGGASGDARELGNIPSTELWAAPEATAREAGEDVRRVALELGERTTQAAQAVVAPILAYAVMMLGAFSRFSAWRQILGASVALILYDLGDNVVLDATVSGDLPVAAIALPTLATLAVSLALLLRAARPGWRRAQASPTAGAAT